MVLFDIEFIERIVFPIPVGLTAGLLFWVGRLRGFILIRIDRTIPPYVNERVVLKSIFYYRAC